MINMAFIVDKNSSYPFKKGVRGKCNLLAYTLCKIYIIFSLPCHLKQDAY